MPLVAIGVYLRTLRTTQKLSQEHIAREIRVSHKQVWKWEQGRAEPSLRLLAQYVRLVHGDPVHIFALALKDDATAEDGRALAEVRLKLLGYGL